MTTTVKKGFESIVALLNANKNKKVETIMPQLLELVSAQKRKTNGLYYNNVLIGKFCWYHKQYELFDEVEFGLKKHSTDGYNQMCKLGVNQWTKAQRDAKAQEASLLALVISGELAASDLQAKLDEINAQKDAIDESTKPIGYSTEEEAINAYLASLA